VSDNVMRSNGGRVSPFEQIRRVNASGAEFWSSREFAQVLGYSDYRNFEQVIQKARLACFNSGQKVEDHFVDVTELIEIGKGGQWAKSCPRICPRLRASRQSNRRNERRSGGKGSLSQDLRHFRRGMTRRSGSRRAMNDKPGTMSNGHHGIAGLVKTMMTADGLQLAACPCWT